MGSKMSNENNNENGMFNISLNSADEGDADLRIDRQFQELTIESNGRDLCHSPDEAAEKCRIISQILELQNTLEDLSGRVDSVKEENFKLKSENEVLGKYIENLMSSSSVFQQAGSKGKSKK